MERSLNNELDNIESELLALDLQRQQLIERRNEVVIIQISLKIQSFS
jgi:hypothetical protein